MRTGTVFVWFLFHSTPNQKFKGEWDETGFLTVITGCSLTRHLQDGTALPFAESDTLISSITESSATYLYNPPYGGETLLP